MRLIFRAHPGTLRRDYIHTVPRSYKYAKLRERKPMTIALGIQCRGGVVLCADSQVTKEGGLKFNEGKIFDLHSDNERILLCYAGSPDIMKVIKERIMKEIPASLTSSQSREAIEIILKDTYRRHGTKRQVEMLCAIYRHDEGVKLFRVAGSVVRPADKAECLGVGDSSVLRFLADTFLRDDITLSQGLTLGCYMVAKAKMYIDGCGGPTQAVFLNHKGKMRNINEVFMDGLDGMDGLPNVEIAIRDLLYELSTRGDHKEILAEFDDEICGYGTPMIWSLDLMEKYPDYFEGPETGADEERYRRL
jgi:20S proteasome alpha/beta subunit